LAASIATYCVEVVFVCHESGVLLTTGNFFDSDAIGAESRYWLKLDARRILFVFKSWIYCLQEAKAKLPVEITAPAEDV